MLEKSEKLPPKQLMAPNQVVMWLQNTNLSKVQICFYGNCGDRNIGDVIEVFNSLGKRITKNVEITDELFEHMWETTENLLDEHFNNWYYELGAQGSVTIFNNGSFKIDIDIREEKFTNEIKEGQL